MSSPLFWLVAQLVVASPEQRDQQVERVLDAAFDCGASIRLEPLPPELAELSELGAAFTVRMSDRATLKQRACFRRRVPTAKVGFISEPPPER